MQKLYKMRNLLALVLIFNLSFAALCGGTKQSRERILIRATDDFAEGQKSVARILATAKETGAISQERIDEIKPFLLQANDYNAKAIEYGKKLVLNPADNESETNLVNTINAISLVLVRANNAGLLKIKNEASKTAFSAAIAALQNTITSIIILTKKN